MRIYSKFYRITKECVLCGYEEIWDNKDDVTSNFERCQYCEDLYCIDCRDKDKCLKRKITL